MSGSVVFKELPGAAAGFSHGKGLPLEIGNSQFLTSIKGMLLSNGQHQTVINDRQHNQIRGQDLTFYNSGIQFGL